VGVWGGGGKGEKSSRSIILLWPSVFRERKERKKKGGERFLRGGKREKEATEGPVLFLRCLPLGRGGEEKSQRKKGGGGRSSSHSHQSYVVY